MRRLAVVAMFLVAGCSSPGATPIIVYVTPGAPLASQPAAVASPPPPVASPAPSGAPQAPSAAPVAEFSPIALSGSGAKVARFSIPDGSAAIAKITASGSADNFAVESLAADGSQNDLLVNTIGAYSGTVLFDQNAGVHSVAFRITASGRWTIKIEPVTSARSWDGTGTLSGKGDDVVAISPPASGLTTITATHMGTANFVITSYDSSGSNLLVNEIGHYSGQTTLPDGSFLLSINADGAWTITVD